MIHTVGTMNNGKPTQMKAPQLVLADEDDEDMVYSILISKSYLCSLNQPVKTDLKIKYLKKMKMELLIKCYQQQIHWNNEEGWSKRDRYMSLFPRRWDK